jgi:hypothetical protein
MTDLLSLLLTISASINAGLAVNLYFARKIIKQERKLHKAAESLTDQALDNAQRADERAAETARIHQELLSRPVQAIIPPGSIEAMANAILAYIHGQEGTIIFPSKGPIRN